MNHKEAAAVLTVHREALAVCANFEAFKLQQLALLDLMIEDYSAQAKREDFLTQWTAVVTLKEEPQS